MAVAGRLNELFGQGFVTLEYLDQMPADEFTALAAFVAEHARLAEKRKEDEDWEDAISQAKRALTRNR